MFSIILIWILIFGIKVRFGYDKATGELFLTLRSRINYKNKGD